MTEGGITVVFKCIKGSSREEGNMLFSAFLLLEIGHEVGSKRINILEQVITAMKFLSGDVFRRSDTHLLCKKLALFVLPCGMG